MRLGGGGGGSAPGEKASPGGVGADGAAYQFRAPAGHHDGLGFEAGIGQQVFLGAAAGIGECAHLPGVELFAFSRQLARHDMRQRQVHVVAAEQDMVAHGHPVQLQMALALQHSNQ